MLPKNFILLLRQNIEQITLNQERHWNENKLLRHLYSKWFKGCFWNRILFIILCYGMDSTLRLMVNISIEWQSIDISSPSQSPFQSKMQLYPNKKVYSGCPFVLCLYHVGVENWKIRMKMRVFLPSSLFSFLLENCKFNCAFQGVSLRLS